MRTVFSSPIAELVLDAGELGLLACGTRIKCDSHGDDSVAARRHLERARAALSEYFDGNRRDFDDLTLAPQGTAFQMRVWRALRSIPFGATRSYGQLAKAIGQPKAIRAVGQANAKNPVFIIQPCHRVIGADGSLVGFGGGLPTKQWLLDHEGRVLESAA
jgi:methylated-DNA-[protein]-cysteine S-methyltransferase